MFQGACPGTLFATTLCSVLFKKMSNIQKLLQENEFLYVKQNWRTILEGEKNQEFLVDCLLYATDLAG